jgi:hypothetical protein
MLHSEISQYTHEQLSDFTHGQLAMSSSSSLITDRTEADVIRWMELRDKGWDAMTEAERLEWMGEIEVTPSAARGMYTHRDLNRVESTIETILNRFKEVGYSAPDLNITTDRNYTSKLLDSDVEEFFRKITVVRGLLPVYPSTPRAPYPGERMDYKLANDIEQILLDVDEISAKFIQSWHFVGELFIGEV